MLRRSHDHHRDVRARRNATASADSSNQSQSGSTPHDRVTVRKSIRRCSLPLDRPRQSAPRYPPAVADRRDNLSSSMPPAAHSSAASPSHNSLHRLDPNQPARLRHSNPHSARGTASRSLNAVSFLGGFRTPALRPAAPSPLGRHPKPFTQADHTAGLPADTEYASSPPITIDRAAALSRNCRLVGPLEMDTIYSLRDRGGCHARSTKRH